MREVGRGCVAVVGLVLLSGLVFAQAEVKVFVGGAMTGPVRVAGAAFARSSGHTVVYVSDTTGALQKRLAAGEKADLIVVTAPAMDALQKENRVVAGSRIDLARALIGVAVRAGAASPDLSTPDAFKAALLAARSVSYVNPASGGTSGTYFEGLMQRMGIAEAMKAKIVYRMQGSEVADAVAKGEAELGISFTSELQPNKGVKVAGTLPAAIQLPTIYSAAIITAAGNGDAARAFLRTLAGPEGRAELRKAGLEPLDPARQLALALPTVDAANVNLWSTPTHALEYLARAESVPHRTEGEGVLLECLPRPLTRVLDLGSGDGRLLDLVKVARPEARAVALDFSMTMIDRLRGRFAADSSVSVIDHDMSDPLPESLGTFDAIVSSFAIHHLPHARKRAIYAEVYGLLAPRGVFCNLEHVASPTATLHEQFLAALALAVGPGEEDPSNKLLDVEAQLAWLRAIGFVDVDCHWKWREFALLAGTRPGLGPPSGE